ncbi:MAG: hypothetical protein ABTQ26_00180 [Azonexus sp.]
MIYVAEVTAHDGSSTATYLFATQGFATGPSDTPANAVARGRLIQPANYSRALKSGDPFGLLETGYGECVVQNIDGALDAMLRLGVDGLQFRLLAKAAVGGSYPADWTVCLVAAMERVEARAQDKVAFILRDGTKSITDRVVCSTFGGSGGLDGTSNMLGQPKPRVYGAPFNAPLTLLNGTDIYMMSDKQYTACYACFDGRSIITNAVAGYDNVANYAALVAASVSSGQVKRCGVDSVVKLGSVPTFPPTFDGTRNLSGYAASYRTQVGEIVYDAAVDAGLTGGQIGSGVASVTGVSSYFVRDTTTTYSQIFNSVARSQNCWVGFDRLGVLQLAKWDAPSGSPVYVFNKHNCVIESFKQIVPNGVIHASGAKNWRVLSINEVANGVKAASLEFATALGKDAMSSAVSGSIPPKHKIAVQYEVNYLGYNGNLTANQMPTGIMTSASTASYQGLVGVERDELVVTAPLSLALLTTLDVGVVVQAKSARFGLSAGKLYRVAGVRYEFAMNKITYTLWG